jgi:preprotein translocase subunit YajC
MDVGFGVVVMATTIAVVFLLVWIVVIVPQNRARKNQEQVVAELHIGEQIVTVGGVIGKLTYLSREEDLARIEVAPGVEIRIIPAAISHPLDYMQRLERLEREANAPQQVQQATAKKK